MKTLQDGKSSFGPGPPETARTAWQNLRLFELAGVLVRVDHIASFIENANHSIMGAAAKLRVAYRVADRVWLAVPKTTEWAYC